METLEKNKFYKDSDEFEGTLLVTISVVSATLICGSFLILYFVLAPEYGFIYNPKVLVRHLHEFSDVFNSITIVSIVTLVSITALIPGLVATLYGLLGIRRKNGKWMAILGIFAAFVGLINFLIILKICTPD